MVKEIDILENDTEMQIVTKVMEYINNNYNYAHEYVNDANVNNTDIYNKFYKYGYLYGIFNEDEIICGNYAALFSALMDRFGIKSLILIGNNHAWNLVYIDDEKYFVDVISNTIIKVDNISMFNDVNNLPEYIIDKEEFTKGIKIFLGTMVTIELVLLVDIIHKRKKYSYLFEDKGQKKYVRKI